MKCTLVLSASVSARCMLRQMACTFGTQWEPTAHLGQVTRKSRHASLEVKLCGSSDSRHLPPACR